MTEQQVFMKRALELAKEASGMGETPVGAVVVRNGEIVGEGRNGRESGKNALYHAEIAAINDACTRLSGWRLWECDLYVTLEPCPMCAGAIINARIKNVYFGAPDKKAGSFGSIVNLTDLPYNHKPNIVGGIMENECSEILSEFFKELRVRKKQEKIKTNLWRNEL